jgi:two-component sensor histidine kinase/HAMP domain-containing protein
MTNPFHLSTTYLKITLSVFLWLGLVLAVACVYIVVNDNRVLAIQTRRAGQDIASVVAASITPPTGKDGRIALKAQLTSFIKVTPTATYLRVETPSGEHLATAGRPVVASDVDSYADPVRADVRNAAGQLTAVVVLGYSSEAIEQALRDRLQDVFVVLLLGLTLLCLLLAALIHRLVGKPIEALGRHVKSLGEGDLHTAVTVGGGGEFRRLADTMDDMRIRIRDQIDHLRRVSEELARENAVRISAEGRLRRSNELQQLLLRELDHRVRNNLASLTGLVTLSERTHSSDGTLAESIRRRVEAMAVVHGLLSSSHWEPIQLDVLIAHLVPAEHHSQVKLSGPSIDVPANQSPSLGMIIQELVTNSLKYGAFSTPSGHVAITWSRVTAPEDGNHAIMISWLETHGPPIDPGSISTGVGLDLVRGFIEGEFDGEAMMEFPASGARLELRIVLRDDQGQSRIDASLTSLDADGDGADTQGQ